jgi:hypothetical protein
MDYYCYNYCCENVTDEVSCTGPTGVGVSGASIDATGNLQLTLTDGTEINVGNVVGPTGVGVSGASIDATGNLQLTLTDGTEQNTGNVVGPTGPGFTNAQISDSGNLEVTTTTGEVIDCGSIVPQPKVTTAGNVASYQIPQGFNTFLNTVDDFAIRITLPTSGNYIGEIFTVSNKLNAAGDSEQTAYIKTTNTTLAADFLLTNAVGGAAFIWNGHFWQLIT